MGDRACVVLIEQGRVLMVHQSYRGRLIWCFPGGEPTPGETAEAAAVREAEEEVGLKVRIERLL